jgi:Zn-dependent protease with chaperone function
MSARSLSLVICAAVAIAATAEARAQEAQPPATLASAPQSGTFDVKAATDAYLAKMTPEQRARSDAYYEGGYWLQLWDFLYGAVVALLLLGLRWSAKMRDLAERVTRFKTVHAAVYWTLYLVVTTLLSFPLTVYEGYTREHQYHLATQTLGPWLSDQAKGLLVGVVMGAILVTALFAVVRKLGGSWWLWGAGVTTVFMAFASLITPVFILPLFNKFTKLNDPKVRESILSLARANGIPATEVYEVDASRQSTRASANVSGFLGTTRITLNDNLLNRSTPEEVQAVMGHEMGHYVLDHVYKGVFFFGVFFVATFAFLRGSLRWSIARWGARWDVRGLTDLAVVPLAALLISVFLFVTTPVLNTFVRTQEFEADMYGINASAQPDGFAEAMLKLGEFRKMDPGPYEEFIFYDHPSGRTRIAAAMRWKAEHLPPPQP